MHVLDFQCFFVLVAKVTLEKYIFDKKNYWCSSSSVDGIFFAKRFFAFGSKNIHLSIILDVMLISKSPFNYLFIYFNCFSKYSNWCSVFEHDLYFSMLKAAVYNNHAQGCRPTNLSCSTIRKCRIGSLESVAYKKRSIPRSKLICYFFASFVFTLLFPFPPIQMKYRLKNRHLQMKKEPTK